MLNPLFKQAVDQGEKNLHIVDPALISDHKARLVLWYRHTALRGMLPVEVVPWAHAYLDEEGKFNKDRMLATGDHLTGTGREAGYSRLRTIGNTNWVFDDAEAADDLMQYEAEVNEVLARIPCPMRV